MGEHLSSARSAQRERSRAGCRDIENEQTTRPGHPLYACPARGACEGRCPGVAAERRVLAAGGGNPVRLQDRRHAYRNRRPWLARGRGLAGAPEQGSPLWPATDHDRGGVQGRRHRQGRCRLAARDGAARPDGKGHRTGAGRSVLRGIFRPRGRKGTPAGQRRLLLAQGHQGQWLRASDRGRGRAGRPDRGQGRPSRR